MKKHTPIQQLIQTAYDDFINQISHIQADYSDNTISAYLKSFRPRITTQLTAQLTLIQQHDLTHGRLLSIGGWPGASCLILQQLADMQPHIIDHPDLIPPALHQFYTQHNITIHPLDFADFDPARPPFTQPFDFIECCQCIEHWNFSPIPFFKALYSQYLIPENGLLYLTIPNAISLYRRLSVLLGNNPYPAISSFIDIDLEKKGAEVSPHWREYTRQDLLQLMEHCGGIATSSQFISYKRQENQGIRHKIYSLFRSLLPEFNENVEGIFKAR
tara:strand:- start:5166 stop:5984 length:819 start_codon:yes stop_codon:yes gene_type:complete